MFLLEGPRAIRDALVSGAADIEQLFVSGDLRDEDVVDAASERGIDHTRVTASVLQAMTDSSTPQGAVAVVRSPLAAIEDVELTGGPVLVLAEVTDPGNVGTLIRTAAAGAADAVLLTTGSCDVLNPKTARATAAALFSVPIVADVPFERVMEVVGAAGYRSVAAEMDAPRSIFETDVTHPICLVLGNEARGLSGQHRRLVDDIVSIPMPGRVDSLNVAVAGGILLFEILRQQRRLSFGAREDHE